MGDDARARSMTNARSPEEVRNTVATSAMRRARRTSPGETIPWGSRRGSPAQCGLLAAKLDEALGARTANERRAVYQYLTGKERTGDMVACEVAALLDWLVGGSRDEGYPLRPNAAEEAQAVYRAAIRAQGQLELPLEAPDMEQTKPLPF